MTHRNHQSAGTDPLGRAREFLGGGDHRGWIFGVCANLARRTGWELWIIRAVAAVCLLTLTLATMAVYFVLGVLMDETRPRTQRKISQWARQADRLVDALWRGIKRFFDESPARRRAPAGDDHDPVGHA